MAIPPGESKQLQAGSAPPVIKGLTVYSMRFCPYSQRVRLLLNHKKVPYDVINIDLNSKPEWFLARSPSGKVPTIEEPRLDPFCDSLIITEYLDAKYPGECQIVPKDPYEKARQKLLIERIVLPFHFMARRTEFDTIVAGLVAAEQLLTTDYFAGDRLGYVDLMVWPWFERLASISEARNKAFEFTLSLYPKLTAWMDRMLLDPAVQATSYSTEFYLGFLRTANASGIMDGDFGL